MPVRQLLQDLASAGGHNLVLADSVRGEVTVRLRRLSLDDALAVTAAAAGYGVQDLGRLRLVSEDGPRPAWLASRCVMYADGHCVCW